MCWDIFFVFVIFVYLSLSPALALSYIHIVILSYFFFVLEITDDRSDWQQKEFKTTRKEKNHKRENWLLVNGMAAIGDRRRLHLGKATVMRDLACSPEMQIALSHAISAQAPPFHRRPVVKKTTAKTHGMWFIRLRVDLTRTPPTPSAWSRLENYKQILKFI